MNYSRIYYSIIDNAKNKKSERDISDLYFEIHHIVPKCMGGSNEENNLVKVTPEEHFICHLLLSKMFPDVYDLFLSIQIMIGSGKYRKRNKEYGSIKRKISKSKKELGLPAETRIKISNSRKGIVFSDSQKEKMSQAKKGKTWEEIFGVEKATQLRKDRSKTRHPMSEEIKEKISTSKKGKNPHVWTNEMREKVSRSTAGRKKPESQKEKLKEYHSKEKTCTHCGFVGNGPAMQRWHFNNCKSKIC